MKALNLILLAVQHIGEKYILGAFVAKNNPNAKGPWDCAEFVSWVVFQVTGKLYGTNNNAGSAEHADGYTGFWKRDFDAGLFEKITLSEAARTPGAVLLRFPGPGLIGHIAFSQGDGTTVEAHSTKTGVIASTVGGRRWDVAFKIPGLDYKGKKTVTLGDKPVFYHITDPLMEGETVTKIQEALTEHGFKTTSDGVFGPNTSKRVADFQKAHGLVADGEVGNETAKSLGIELA